MALIGIRSIVTFLTLELCGNAYHLPRQYSGMCSAGGPIDVDLNDPLKEKGKRYRCDECGQTFTGLGKHPMCPSCQSENVAKI
jgi:DNA-directed RNA polymerase subunit RPC12/RpoP